MLVFLQIPAHLVFAAFVVALSRLQRRPVYVATALRRQKPILRHIAGPGAFAFRGVTPRFRKRWQQPLKRAFAPVSRAVFRAGRRDRIVFVHWGYSSLRRFGYPLSDLGYREIHAENGLLGFGVREKRDLVDYVADRQRPYFDARGPSDLEEVLNTLPVETLRADPAVGRFLAAVRESSIQKFGQYNQTWDTPLSAADLLIVGQVRGDAAWLCTESTVATNAELVAAAVAAVPEARRVFFKPHPRNPETAAERAEIARRFPGVVEVPRDVSLKTLFRARPVVAVNTSGAGLDAGLAGCRVITFGNSFYTGWGATEDHGPAIPRRRARLSFADIHAGFMLRYTRIFHRAGGADAALDEVIAAIEAYDRPAGGGDSARLGA